MTEGDNKVLADFAQMDADSRFHIVRQNQKNFSGRLESLVPGSTWFFRKHPLEIQVGTSGMVSRAMQVDKAVREHEESNMESRTIRQAMTIDNCIKTNFLVQAQDDETILLRLALNTPLETIGVGRRRIQTVTRSAAKDVVLSAISEHLHHHVGLCVPFDQGRRVEVRVLDEAAVEDIVASLSLELGTVTLAKQTAFQRDAALTAIMFSNAFDTVSVSPKFFKAPRSTPTGNKLPMVQKFDSDASLDVTQELPFLAAEDEDPRAVRESLQRSFKAFDSRLARSSFLTEAADRAGARAPDPWYVKLSGGAVAA